MTSSRRAVCLHGHYYQPPRAHPWLGVVDPEPSAAPEHDWNARITNECYAPTAVARVLDGAGRLRDVVNLYEWTSFDLGPTLAAWMAGHRPDVLAELQRADAVSRMRTGFGNAWAQAYSHPILPLCTPRDVRTQILWGARDFEARFGRPPEGMWLPEMAVDLGALTALAEAGITLTMLAPHQARRIRPLGGGDWQVVTPDGLDVSRVYRCRVGGDRFVDVVFRDAGLSQDVAFGALLRDGAVLARRLVDALAGADGGMVTVAVDGETYGHHHRFGEMALAFAVDALRRDPTVSLVGPAAFREGCPPTHEVEIVESTSWSCPHGVERWRADCGCRTGGADAGSQAWRAPLRTAIDWLRDEVAVLYETRAGDVLRDPWGARDRYVDCVLEPGRMAAFVGAEAPGRLSPAEIVRARRTLELARHALLMQTSCGWFFDELTGVEPRIVLGHAARAIELADDLGRRLEDGFLDRLEAARSNLPDRQNGAELYRRAIRRRAATPQRVAATAALQALAGQATRVPGYEVAFSTGVDGDRLVGEARVTEGITGATASVPVMAERPPGGAPWCRVGEQRFGLGDLFAVQRVRLLDAVAREAASAARTGRREALARVRPLLDPLLEGDTSLPLEIAVLLGYEEADAMAGALEVGAVSLRPLVVHAQALRRRGVVFPTRWLATRIGRVLEEKVGDLPESAEEALLLLDLATASGAMPDLARVQVRALIWWRDADPETRAEPRVAQLCDRLRLAIAPPTG